MNLLEVKNIKKSFDDLEVLKDISMSVAESEVISILGPSGSGKSTFLRCMTMLEKIDGGSMEYCGKEAVNSDSGVPVYADRATLKEIQSYYGLVFQNFNLFPQYTVLKNLTLAPTLLKKGDSATIEAKAKEIIKKVGLEDKLDFYPCMLSGGQQQRVAIARALMLSPKILCFDEPTSALDPELTGEVLRVIRELKDGDTTMIIVTHEMTFAMHVSSRILFIDDRNICVDSNPKEFFENPANDRVRDFLGHFNN